MLGGHPLLQTSFLKRFFFFVKCRQHRGNQFSEILIYFSQLQSVQGNQPCKNPIPGSLGQIFWYVLLVGHLFCRHLLLNAEQTHATPTHGSLDKSWNTICLSDIFCCRYLCKYIVIPCASAGSTRKTKPTKIPTLGSLESSWGIVCLSDLFC